MDNKWMPLEKECNIWSVVSNPRSTTLYLVLLSRVSEGKGKRRIRPVA